MEAADAVAELVFRFRQSLPCLNVNYRLTGGTPTHPKLPIEPQLQFTFDDTEVATALGVNGAPFVVHHGDRTTRSDVRMVRLLDEHLIIWASTARGLFPLSHGTLGEIFRSRISSWAQLGRGTGPIRLLAHGGPINTRVLDAFLARNFGTTIAGKIELFASYEDLADAASDDCLVLGLRAAYAAPGRLVPVLIDGIKPWAAGEESGAPNLPVFIGWRVESPAPLREIADYLALVAGNLTADALALGRIAETVDDTPSSATYVPPLDSLRSPGISSIIPA